MKAIKIKSSVELSPLGKSENKSRTIGQSTPSIDDHFGYPSTEFDLLVPRHYNHEKQLDRFAAVNTKRLYLHNYALRDKNFKDTTTKLCAGDTYRIKMFPVLSAVTSADCLNFLNTQHAKLVGGQGLTLVWTVKRELLPIDAFIISLDKDVALWFDGNNIRIPTIYRYDFDVWGFGLGFYNGGCIAGHYLLGFVPVQ